jgi:hypothetical protein
LEGCIGAGFIACYDFVFRAWIDTRKLEGVLDGIAYVAGVATLGDFRVVRTVKKGHLGCLAIRDPDVNDGNLCVTHALGGEIDGDQVFNVLFFETLGFSERSGVVLSKDARDGTSKGILDLE